MRPAVTLLFALLMLVSSPYATATSVPQARVLVFSRTAGWRHDSIPTAVATLQRLGAQQGMQVDHTEDANSFGPARLARYNVVVFANTTLDVLDEAQQAALESFVQGGGGFMALHSAADTEYGWAWYGQLVGAWFANHPPGLQTTRVIAEHDGIATGETLTVTDEIYNYRSNPRVQVEVTATVKEEDYAGGSMGADHPIAWCHAFDGGRSWYTGLGHEIAVYGKAEFQQQLIRGLRYASGLSAEC
jgi:type 1 glutamine amidotransferase